MLIGPPVLPQTRIAGQVPTLLWGLLLLASTFLLSGALGVPLPDVVRYLVYLVAYVLIPGICLYLVFTSSPRDSITIILHGFVLGQLAEMWCYTTLLAVRREGLFAFYP